MSWFESQIDTRARYDAELTERAYAELATSVSAPDSAPYFHPDDLEQADGAVRTCLRYCGVRPGAVPDGIRDVDERIDWLCRPSGTMRRAVHLSEGWYKHAFGAMLGSLETGEPVALLPERIRGYYYREPGSGKKVHLDTKTAAHISTDAVLFYRPLPARPLKIRDLISFITRSFNKNDYILVIAAAAIATIIGLVPAWANNIAFGTVVPSGQDDLIGPIAALLLGAAVSTVLIGATRNLVMARLSSKLKVTIEAAAFSRLLSLPTSFFKEYASGDLAYRLNIVSQMAQAFATMLLGTGLTSVFSLVYIGQIGVYAPLLALPALAIVLIEAVLTAVVTLLTMRYEKLTMAASATLSGTETALLNGVSKIKLAGAEDRAFAKWAHHYSEYAHYTYNRPTLLRALPALVALVSVFGAILIYYLAGSTQVTVANYMAFNVAYGQVSAAIMAFANMAGSFAQIKPMLEEVAPILEATPEISEDKPSVSSLVGSIEVSDVSFRYSENGPYIVKDLSFKIRPGEYVALVGKSGCGKSTIMRLLLGFEQPESGSIFYGPYDVSKVDLRSLRQHIGVVMQDGKLFMGDLASNITISAPTATLDDAWEAAEIAGVADDIRKMPMGMQTLVTEGGGGVSGGQRQRLMIARAVCGKRRILMFDEATSALDNKTQKHVSDSLDALKCTRIVVAHRLSTIRHCDRIMVVDGGRIAEEGTYEELLAKGGLFAELVARQRLDVEG